MAATIIQEIMGTVPEQPNEWESEYFSMVTQSVSAATGIYQQSTERIVHVNSLFEKALGYRANEVAATPLLLEKIMSASQIPLVRTQIYELNKHPEGNFVNYSLTDAYGCTKSYCIYFSALLHNGQHYRDYFFCFLLAFPRNQALPFHSFESKNLFLGNFQQGNAGTFEILLSSGLVRCSQTTLLIFGLQENPNQDFIGAFIRRLNYDDYINAKKTLFIADPMPENFEFALRLTLPETTKILHCSGIVKCHPDGMAYKLLGTVRDVTAQKLIENDLNKKIVELNNTNKELEEFAYIASHDLLEPLRKITTFAGRLNEKYRSSLPDDGVEILQRTLASAENMRLLINDLLDFSRIPKTAQPFDSVNLNAVFRIVKSELELSIEETGTTIDCTQLPTIEAISSQMNQLFTNILTNAIKFRKEGTAPHIVIQATMASQNEKIKNGLPANSPYYEITFSDNGIGFEEEYATKIFQIFQRLHGKREFPGSGIGLAICKKIIEYHHGIIYAAGTPNVGAKFTVLLPALQPIKD
jgi:signal transduction histidine kinase